MTSFFNFTFCLFSFVIFLLFSYFLFCLFYYCFHFVLVLFLFCSFSWISFHLYNNFFFFRLIFFPCHFDFLKWIQMKTTWPRADIATKINHDGQGLTYICAGYDIRFATASLLFTHITHTNENNYLVFCKVK